jgi:hypothetical protein
MDEKEWWFLSKMVLPILKNGLKPHDINNMMESLLETTFQNKLFDLPSHINITDPYKLKQIYCCCLFAIVLCVIKGST